VRVGVICNSNYFVQCSILQYTIFGVYLTDGLVCVTFLTDFDHFLTNLLL